MKKQESHWTYGYLIEYPDAMRMRMTHTISVWTVLIFSDLRDHKGDRQSSQQDQLSSTLGLFYISFLFICCRDIIVAIPFYYKDLHNGMHFYSVVSAFCVRMIHLCLLGYYTDPLCSGVIIGTTMVC